MSEKPKEESFRDHPDLQIVSRDFGVPYSKGLMAQSIMATGLPPERAYHVAQEIERHLIESGESSITMLRLREIAQQVLGEEEGQSFTERYRLWRQLRQLERPLIILIGGATGVGKSTLATQVAHRLGVTRLTSTDAIRQVMRACFSKNLMPSIHYSSFEAGKVVRAADKRGADRDISGFVSQIEKVCVGVNAIIERTIKEGMWMVVEGAHVVPGFLNEKQWKDALVIQLLMVVEDEESHRSHFVVRDQETEGVRSLEKYVENLEKIRRVQGFLIERARAAGVPVIDNHSIDDAVKIVMGIVLDAVNQYQKSCNLKIEVN
ncbi:MAG: 2-phosphoglycerate kinase [Actinobacteria bacterium]|nr:2-phosphoglycerate kinase [Actinomycetota bacterium]